MSEYTKCRQCGAWIDANNKFCPNCGTPAPQQAPQQPYGGGAAPYGGYGPKQGGCQGGYPGQPQGGYGQPSGGNQNGYGLPQGGFSQAFLANDAFAASPQGASRGVAALLAIFLGSLGIHYFYVGRNTAGIIFLLVTLLSCGIAGAIVGVVALAQGINMFVIDNRQFYNTYVNTDSTLPLF